MTEPLKVIQVGLGGWGRSWASVLAERPDVCATAAWVDVSPAMLDALQEELTVDPTRCFPSLDAALHAVDADVVLVTTALPGHMPVAVQALEAGKHVLVEKPMAPTMADAQRMVDAARAADRRLMVNQNYRFYPAARTVQRLIAERVLGEVGSARIAFRKYGNTAPVGQSAHYTLPDPLLLDMSIHHFDLMRFVLGQEPVSVGCHAWNPSWSRFGDPAEAVAVVEFSGGAVADYHGSWTSTGTPTLWAGHWVIECAEGTIEWTGRDDTTIDGDAVMLHPRGGESQTVVLDEVDAFDRVGSMAELRAALAQNREPLTSGADNLSTLALTLDAIASSRTGRPHKIGEGTK